MNRFRLFTANAPRNGRIIQVDRTVNSFFEASVGPFGELLGGKGRMFFLQLREHGGEVLIVETPEISQGWRQGYR